ncbi:MAG: hypothetical protein LBH49_02810 [Puniceicoccales bacterium]|nr:hypothetical protein [Puniceicoccales bacterium]
MDKFIEYILAKLKADMDSDLIELYNNIIADLIPNKNIAIKLCDANLKKIDCNFKAIKLSMSGLCDKFFCKNEI